jgi:hypothetical protein
VRMTIRRVIYVFSIGLLATAGGRTAVRAQEAASSLCRNATCTLHIDWGSQGTPSFVDRRYGAPGTFEEHVMKGLAAAGYRFSTAAPDSALRIRLRPRIARAVCDLIPGTNPDQSCQTIGDVAADFLTSDKIEGIPGNIRIRNRCGNNQMMTIQQFGEYVAGMLDYTLARDKEKKRPTARC